MTKIYTVNASSSNGGPSFFYSLKTTLVSAGWVVSASSDGTTLSGSSDIITHSGSGEAGLMNPLAWFWIKDPAGLRSFTVQRSNGSNPDENWRIKWIRTGSMNLNTGSVTITPSSSFEQVVVGSGSDVVPLYQRFVPSTGSVYKTHIVALNTAETSKNVYPFWGFTTNNGTGNCKTIFSCDVLKASPSDPEPYAIFTAFNDTELTDTILGPATAEATTLYSSLAYIKFWNGTAFVPGSMNVHTGAGASTLAWTSFSTAANPFDASEGIFPIIFHRSSASTFARQLKGYSLYSFVSTVDRNFPTTINLTTDAKIYVGSWLFPWPNSVTPEV